MNQKISVIFGTVRDFNGKPVSEARASFVAGPVPFQDIAALTDTNGNFALTVPVAGEYVIEVVSEGFMPKKTLVVVKSNEKKYIELILSKN